MARVEITAPARRDLDGIWDYLAEESVESADRIIDRIADRCSLYATQPDLGTPADRFSAGLRAFVVASYVIFYRAESNGILVIRVLHGAQDLERILGREQ